MNRLRKIALALSLLLVASISGAWVIKDTASPVDIYTGSNTTPTISAATSGSVTLGPTAAANTSTVTTNGSLGLAGTITGFSSADFKYVGNNRASWLQKNTQSGTNPFGAPSGTTSNGSLMVGLYYDGTTLKYSDSNRTGSAFSLFNTDGAGKSFIWSVANNASHSADTAATATEVGSIDLSGTWTFPFGVKLPTSGGTAQTLDYYQDFKNVSWSPTVTCNSGTCTGTSTLSSFYTAIGSQVCLQSRITTSTGGNNTAIKVTLPITAYSGSRQIALFPTWTNTASQGISILDTNTSSTFVLVYSDGAGASGGAGTLFANSTTTNIALAFCYMR